MSCMKFYKVYIFSLLNRDAMRSECALIIYRSKRKSLYTQQSPGLGVQHFRRCQHSLQRTVHVPLSTCRAGNAGPTERCRLQVFGALPLGCRMRQSGVGVLQQRNVGVCGHRVWCVPVLGSVWSWRSESKRSNEREATNAISQNRYKMPVCFYCREDVVFWVRVWFFVMLAYLWENETCLNK